MRGRREGEVGGHGRRDDSDGRGQASIGERVDVVGGTSSCAVAVEVEHDKVVEEVVIDVGAEASAHFGRQQGTSTHVDESFADEGIRLLHENRVSCVCETAVVSNSEVTVPQEVIGHRESSHRLGGIDELGLTLDGDIDYIFLLKVHLLEDDSQRGARVVLIVKFGHLR